MKFGMHVSAAGGIDSTVGNAAKFGCETMQIFVNPPQRWNPVEIPEEQTKSFLSKNQKAKIEPIFIHSIYLINLASHNTFFYNQSIVQLVDCLEKTQKIKATGVVTHLGSAKVLSRNEAIKKIAAGIDQVLEKTSYGDFIIENSAGAGNIIGDKFDEIGAIIKLVKNKDRLKVALDTAHAYGSGYNVATEEGLAKTLAEFNKLIGLEKLVLIHGNDTEVELGSCKDRHANIGQGKIGTEGFKRIINHPKLKHLPFILETPGFGSGEEDKKELGLLKDLDGSRKH